MNLIRKPMRLVAAFATLAVAATGLLATGAAEAAPLAAGTASSGTPTLSPTTGGSATNFTISLPAGAACPGDGTAGYRWQTFIVSNSLDASQLKYTGGTPAIAGSAAGTVVQPLFSSGNPIVDQNPALTTGAVTVAGTQFQFSVYPAGTFTAGVYKIGVACTDSAGDTQRFWSAPLTIATTGSFSWTYGAAPSAITLALTSFTATSCTVGITAPTAVPSATVTITYTPTGTIIGGATTVSGAPSSPTSDVRTGLVQGQTYAVTASQTNGVGSAAGSNTVSCTPSVTLAAPAVTATPAVLSVAVTWTASGTPTNYTVNAFSCPGTTANAGVCTTAVSGSPFTAAGTSQLVGSLTAGTLYYFEVTANYAAGTSAPAGNANATALANTLLSQTLTVTRPVGALVITQRCGVFGPMASETVPGFGTIAAETASGGTTGTAPTLTGGGSDPLFGQYPYPVDGSGVPTGVNYPTFCGVSLGTGALITSGALAGDYFTATGRVPQLTVIDTRDSDSAWTLSGSVSDFTSGANSFSGNYLGWTPQVNFTSAPTLAGYDQVVTAGAAVNPSSAATATGVNNVPGAGLGVSRTAASANAGQGLGLAQVDTRLKLIIPLTAKNGTYTATLTFSVV
ncbi:MAG: hypothetical protein KGR47_13260 [Acidobacteria bacterium]|nr:hypothetical protein [Acidobacteriota bacterium]